jgi:hypothetical protein
VAGFDREEDTMSVMPEHHELKEASTRSLVAVVVVMGLAFFYLVIAFGLGAAVTKLRPA